MLSFLHCSLFQLNVSPEDGYATMITKYSLWAQHKAFRRLLEPVDRTEFGTSSAVVNAFYSSVKNGISESCFWAFE